jgi:divalent metal cation (Fe/Co/Zn/Cd) transporter
VRADKNARKAIVVVRKFSAMSDERSIWTRHSLYLALFTSFFHVLQFGAGLLLWFQTASAVLIAFALDAGVSAIATLLLALSIQRRGADARWQSRFAAYGYIFAAAASLYFGASALWYARGAQRTVLGIVLAAVSMLVIPIIGSYMKTLGVELRSQALRSAAVFTFGNSYLSMVLLIALLMNTGMDLPIGDALGALVMVPFMAQKGIQILIDEGRNEYVED